MADKDPVAKPKEPPKPVHIGGESLLDRILPHLKKIIVGIIVLAVVLTIIFAIRYFKERKQIAATEKLVPVMEVVDKPVMPAGEKPDPKAPPSFPGTKEKATAVLDTMTKQGTDTPTPAFKASMLVDAGRLEEAIDVYKKCVADTALAKQLDGVLCREGLGLAQEAKATAEKDPAARQKGYEEALATFQSMQPDEAGPRRAYALYHTARMQLLLGKKADAKASFEKAKEANKDLDREIADMIEKRLAALGAT